MYGIIYLTTNTVTGARYIGQHKCLTLEDNYIGSGKILCAAVKKYGSENFERSVLWICESKAEADLMEKYFIWFCGAVKSEYFYNLTAGGEGSEGCATYKKAVCHYINGEIEKFESMKIASIKTGIDYSTIKHRCNGTRSQKSENDYWFYEGDAPVFKNRNRHRKSEKVECVETGTIYCSYMYAGEKTGISYINISRAARGLRESAGGLHWRNTD